VAPQPFSISPCAGGASDSLPAARGGQGGVEKGASVRAGSLEPFSFGEGWARRRRDRDEALPPARNCPFLSVAPGAPSCYHARVVEALRKPLCGEQTKLRNEANGASSPRPLLQRRRGVRVRTGGLEPFSFGEGWARRRRDRDEASLRSEAKAPHPPAPTTMRRGGDRRPSMTRTPLRIGEGWLPQGSRGEAPLRNEGSE
jgi:hypothetical protein